MTHKGTVTLETKRLILRRFTPDDLEPMFNNCWSEPDVWKWTNYEPMNSLDDVLILNNIFTDFWFKKYEKDDCYNWAIQLKATKEVIGRLRGMNLNERIQQVELTYELGRKWWNQGYATEATKTVVNFFFKEVGLHRIYANHADKNPASGRVMKKCGMIYEGISRDWCVCNAGRFDGVNYAILASDYFNTAPKEITPQKSNVDTLKSCTELMFHNLKIAMDTVDWNANVCGAPAWRYIYHTLHSADKWFINPSKRFDEPEPSFHTPKLDWPDTPSDTIISREVICEYYKQVREKILDYIGGLDDLVLSEIPDGCKSTRLGLILSQFRHMYAHIGILNGITIASTGQYPRVINEGVWRSGKLPEGLYDDEVRQ
ncbi:MAG: GNAT family N-acetyltransferase [Eubacteriales bacterium]|nr:GNAT family N-acetyltransferase [Eubacteriales bacterium]